MSKRYGRNQRRHAREAIASLELDKRNYQIAAEASSRRLATAHAKMRQWADRIVARLSHESAFALDKAVQEWSGGDRFMARMPGRVEPVSFRLERMAESFTEDLITMFVHHVESTYDKRGGRDLRGQLVLHLYRGPSHEPLYIALSAQQMDEIKYSKDPEYVEFLVRGLARQFAKHAEEMQRG